jgi:hypothetical protein
MRREPSDSALSSEYNRVCACLHVGMPSKAVQVVGIDIRILPWVFSNIIAPVIGAKLTLGGTAYTNKEHQVSINGWLTRTCNQANIQSVVIVETMEPKLHIF